MRSIKRRECGRGGAPATAPPRFGASADRTDPGCVRVSDDFGQRDEVLEVSLEVGRFAPSTTGPAHPGTLLAAMLCWLDARARGARVVLRLEDLDPERSRAEWVTAMGEDLAWMGLSWDAVEAQSERGEVHAQALDRLEQAGLLYPCVCSRKDIARAGVRAPDGGWRYGNRCRERELPATGWRASREALRVRLPAEVTGAQDESGLVLALDASLAFGDPVVRRRDGAVAYHLASVVDDHAAGVTRVVRGRDLAITTATQVALQKLLGYATPSYRHHLLLLEEQGGKLAKLHGAVGSPELRRAYTPQALCGFLAHAAGLQAAPDPTTPSDLLGEFDWEKVGREDRVVHWTGSELTLREVE